MELNASVHSVFCITLLFECVLQGKVVCRQLVQGVNCRLGSGCLAGLGAGLCCWGMGSGMVFGTCLGGAHGHKVGTGFGMDKLQQWGAGGGCGGGGGGMGVRVCNQVDAWLPQGSTTR